MYVVNTLKNEDLIVFKFVYSAVLTCTPVSVASLFIYSQFPSLSHWMNVMAQLNVSWCVSLAAS